MYKIVLPVHTLGIGCDIELIGHVLSTYPSLPLQQQIFIIPYSVASLLQCFVPLCVHLPDKDTIDAP